MHVDIAGYTRHADSLLLKEVSAYEERILSGRIASFEEYKYALGRIQGIHESRRILHELRDTAMTNAGETEYD